MPATFASGEALEQVVLVEDEAGRLVAVGGGDGEERRQRRVELGVPVQVAVVVRVEAGDHRRRRRARPRRRADRLVEPHAAAGELVDRRSAHVAGAVAADVVGTQRVGDVDDQVRHARRPRRRAPRGSRPRIPSGSVEPEQLEHGRRDVEQVRGRAGRAPSTPAPAAMKQAVLGVVRVVRAGVVLERVDALVSADRRDRAPEQVAEDRDQVGRDAVHLGVELLGPVDARVQRPALVVGDRLRGAGRGRRGRLVVGRLRPSPPARGP